MIGWLTTARANHVDWLGPYRKVIRKVWVIDYEVKDSREGVLFSLSTLQCNPCSDNQFQTCSWHPTTQACTQNMPGLLIFHSIEMDLIKMALCKFWMFWMFLCKFWMTWSSHELSLITVLAQYAFRDSLHFKNRNLFRLQISRV